MKKIVNNRIITYQITDNITIDIEHTMFKNDVVLVFWMRHVQYPVKGVMTIVNVKDVHPDVIINTGKRHPFNREPLSFSISSKRVKIDILREPKKK